MLTTWHLENVAGNHRVFLLLAEGIFRNESGRTKRPHIWGRVFYLAKELRRRELDDAVDL